MKGELKKKKKDYKSVFRLLGLLNGVSCRNLATEFFFPPWVNTNSIRALLPINLLNPRESEVTLFHTVIILTGTTSQNLRFPHWASGLGSIQFQQSNQVVNYTI